MKLIAITFRYLKVIRVMMIVGVTINLISGCASTSTLPSNSSLMNIWVSPEYIETKKKHGNHYIAVVVTGLQKTTGNESEKIESVVR